MPPKQTSHSLPHCTREQPQSGHASSSEGSEGSDEVMSDGPGANREAAPMASPISSPSHGAAAAGSGPPPSAQRDPVSHPHAGGFGASSLSRGTQGSGSFASVLSPIPEDPQQNASAGPVPDPVQGNPALSSAYTVAPVARPENASNAHGVPALQQAASSTAAQTLPSAVPTGLPAAPSAPAAPAQSLATSRPKRKRAANDDGSSRPGPTPQTRYMLRSVTNELPVVPTLSNPEALLAHPRKKARSARKGA
ncbi:hypothetical protein F5Y06DRAFT_307386 [Hypoxylon sp. FL0890]|nr:hypothetical protein F5Y06DRAFT_307386 [Hypoxylon sp. FL0890]